ncbi:MAG: DUF305 domain-containing protein [Candidatus Nanopelagicales bacterium]
MKYVRPFVLAVIGTVAVAALSACTDNSADSTMNGMSDDPSNSSTLSGQDADIAFAQLMIPHHTQAIEMADLALQYGNTKEVKALASQIKAAQDPEIAQMTQWLGEWNAPLQMPGSDDSGMPGMDMGGMSASGMMSEDEMNALAQARGADFDRMWLQMMIAHHEGAVAMAEQVLTTTDDEQVKALAENVVSGQNAEIDTMQQLLAG